ncbi:MAG: hypothetical protein JSW11_01495 [Candidatus Heimdallarchaeota archaeon]|nr:MAG: hypothetical protein JSW11_01495 [Candidatus Heimdallarchaeota archaeon]
MIFHFPDPPVGYLEALSSIPVLHMHYWFNHPNSKAEAGLYDPNGKYPQDILQGMFRDAFNRGKTT